MYRLQTTDAITRTARALGGLKVKGQQTTPCAHTVQVSRLWREVVGESRQDVVAVAVLRSSLFVLLSGTNLVSEYDASTGRLQQRHPVAGLGWPQDMAKSIQCKSNIPPHSLAKCEYPVNVRLLQMPFIFHLISKLSFVLSCQPVPFLTLTSRLRLQG